MNDNNLPPSGEQLDEKHTFMYHTSPAPPPSKKQRATGTPNPRKIESSMSLSAAKTNAKGTSASTTFSVDKAISTRRAELMKLKQRLQSGNNSGSAGVIALARSHLDSPALSSSSAAAPIPGPPSTSTIKGRMRPPSTIPTPPRSKLDDTPKKSEFNTLPSSKTRSLLTSRKAGILSASKDKYSVTKKDITVEEKKQEPTSAPTPVRVPAPAVKPEVSAISKPSATVVTFKNKDKVSPNHFQPPPKEPELVEEYDQNEEDISPPNDTNNSVIYTPYNTTSVPTPANTKNTPFQPRKLILSPNPQPPPSTNAKLEDNLENSHEQSQIDDKQEEVRTFLSTTSSQETKETSHKPPHNDESDTTIASSLAPSLPENENNNSNKLSHIAEESPSDFIRRMGQLVTDSQSVNNSTITMGDAPSIMSYGTRDSTTSLNTGRLVKQLRQVNDEKAAALRAVARLETELENRIREESEGKNARMEQIMLEKKRNSDAASNASSTKKIGTRNGALAMLICVTERRVKKATLRNAWKHWKNDVFGDENKSPSDSRRRNWDDDGTLSLCSHVSLLGFPGETGRMVHLSRASGLLSPSEASAGSSRYRQIMMRSPQPKHASLTSLSQSHIRDALAAVSSEYTSSAANFYVRTIKLNNEYPVMPQDVYDQVLDPNVPETLEVYAEINADDSVLVLHGESASRHMTKSGEIIREVESVDEISGSLGYVSYIDCDGMESEYFLDTICEELISARNAFCSSVISAAFVLKKATPVQTVGASQNLISNMPPTGEMAMNRTYNEVPPKNSYVPQQETMATLPPPTFNPNSVNKDIPNNVSHSIPPPVISREVVAPLETQQLQKEHRVILPKEEISIPPTEPSTQAPVKEEKKQQKLETHTVDPKKATSEVEMSGSNDMLSDMIVFVVSSVFSFIWFLLVGLPWRITKFTLKMSFYLFIFTIIWMYFADDNGASKMGALIMPLDFYQSEF